MAKCKDHLTEMQQRFVDAYLSDPNLGVVEAALKAGYTESSALSESYRMLRKPLVAKALDKEIAARARRTRITKDQALKEIAAIAYSNVDDYEVDKQGNISLKEGADILAMKAISSVERTHYVTKEGKETVTVKFKLWEKPKALDMISRHLNLFKADQEAGAPKISTYSKEREEMALKLIGYDTSDKQDEENEE